MKIIRIENRENRGSRKKISGQSDCDVTADWNRLFCVLRGIWVHMTTKQGFQRVSLWHTTLLAKCSVLYALSALLWKCSCRRVGKHIWSSGKTGLWLRGAETQAQGWFRQQTGRIWKPSSLFPRWTSKQNVPNLWTHSRKSGRVFLSKLKWAGSHFKGFPALIAYQQRWAKLSTAAHLCAVHLDRWLDRLALQFPITLINAFSSQSPLLQAKLFWDWQSTFRKTGNTKTKTATAIIPIPQSKNHFSTPIRSAKIPEHSKPSGMAKDITLPSNEKTRPRYSGGSCSWNKAFCTP